METKNISLENMNYNNDEIIANVYQTSDYERFTTFAENRAPDHVAQIVDSMTRYGAIDVPIKVTVHEQFPGKLVIVDGNNSFNARVILGLPIPYIIIKDATQKEMAALNIVAKKWNSKDFVKLYAGLNYKEYIVFKSFLDTYPEFTVRSMERILRLSNTSDLTLQRGSNHHTLQNGKFKCKNVPESKKVIDFLYAVRDSIHPGCKMVYKDEKFISAIIHLWNNKDFNPDFFLAKLNSAAGSIICPQRKTEECYQMIDNIYNYQVKKNRVNLIPNGRN